MAEWKTPLVTPLYKNKGDVSDLNNYRKIKRNRNVALTTDLWTSSQNEAIVTLTGHFVNKNGDLEDCVLETKSFASARQTGENISIQLNSITIWYYRKCFGCNKSR
jgi:hypothetical protein